MPYVNEQTTQLMNQERAAALAERFGLKGQDVGFVNLKAGVESTDAKTRSFTARITSERIDRDREVLVCDGMDGTEFQATGGTIFWNHDYNRPLGSADKLTKGHDSWTSRASIATRPEDFQGEFFPDFAWAMVNQGIVRGISVGFQPVEWRDATAKDFELYGEGVERVHSKWKLLEWSIAPLQSNIDALVVAVNKGLIAPDVARQLGADIEPLAPRRNIVVVSVVSTPSPAPSKAAEQRKIQTAIREAVARAKGKIYI